MLSEARRAKDSGASRFCMGAAWKHPSKKDFPLVLEMVKGVKNMVFGGEGMFFAQLRGPGKVWLQSLPLARLANRIVGASKVGGSHGGEQGSVLGGLGSLFEKD